MTLTLILMRHAKSSWDDPTQSDHDRPLNARGVRSAKAMGDWLRSHAPKVDQALVSTATRTRETFAGLSLDLVPGLEPDLYHAAPATMARVMAGATGQTFLMIGHNPGIADFARLMVRTAPNHPRFADFPTCATLVARLDAPTWADVAPHSATPLAFAIPREVMRET